MTTKNTKNINNSVPEAMDSGLRIGIFGGTFNPLHNGHVALAKAFLRQAGLDEVWFVVSPQNPFKKNDALLADSLRLEMVRRAVADIPRMRVSDVEFHLPKPSYMYLTLRHLSAAHPDCTFTLLIGGDNWAAFDRWANADEILANYDIVVYPRSGEVIDPATLPANVRILDTQLIDISSTDIRRRIAMGLPITDLVPPAISAFIAEKGLYK